MKRHLLIKLIALMMFSYFLIFNNPVHIVANAEARLNSNQECNEKLQLSLQLERIYLDGEISEEKTVESITSLEQLMEKYSNWYFVEVNNDVIVLQQYVDDISPLLKANGYFGISEDGILTIYDGKPNINNVIQSFFQIDVKKLESNHHDRLKKGIPIKSRADYVEVIEAYQHYTIN